MRLNNRAKQPTWNDVKLRCDLPDAPATRATKQQGALKQPTVRAPKRNERGATMVEFAMISVALFTLIFGIIEGSFAVRARNAVNNAVDDAARAGAVAGTNADADWIILNQIIGRGAADSADIRYVTVYSASSGSDGADPAACEANPASPVCQCIAGLPQPNVCNVYGPTTISQIDTNRPDFASGSLGTQWPPSSRSGTDLGFIGVYIAADYAPILNQLFFEFDFEVNASSLQTIETTGYGIGG